MSTQPQLPLTGGQLIAARDLIIAEFPRLEGKLGTQTALIDLDLDSLDRLNLVMRAEQKFDIEIDDATIEAMATVADFARAIFAPDATNSKATQ